MRTKPPILFLIACAASAQGLAQTPVPRTDAYESWRLAKEAASATDPTEIQALPGFEVELLRSALPEEDSWVALAFDPKGRLTIAREKQGLIRLTLNAPVGRAVPALRGKPTAVTSVEVIEDSLLECRGLLYAEGALYVHANNSKEFYRLRDTDGDERFDEKILLLETAGGVGHGRNHLRHGPDNRIYLVQGDSVELPVKYSRDSPFRNYAVDEFAPSALGKSEDKRFKNRHREPYGYILAYDPRGDESPPDSPSRFTLMAGGMRNPLDVDFNRDGEPFVYDADMEWDAGLPWYRPTRVLHVVSGGEYGWRRSPSTFPVYYEDSLPPVIDIGLGSPTGVLFAHAAKFPRKYRDALLIADWAYGRILAIHLTPGGASYTGEMETFVSGRPLNVTDMTIGPDGALYFITGGRKTQSGLYRVTYEDEVGRVARPAEAQRRGVPNPPSPAATAAVQTRLLRRELESLHTPGTAGAVEKAWPHLDHEDRWIRYAARIAIENQPPEHWQLKALRSDSLTAKLAVARVGHRFAQDALLKALHALDLEPLPEQELLLVLRIYQLAFIRMGAPEGDTRQACLEKLDALYPSRHRLVNHELCELLVYLESPPALDKTLALLTSAEETEDLIQYLYHASLIKSGWTSQKRRSALEALARAETFRGGRTYIDATTQIRSRLIANLGEQEKDELGNLLEKNTPAAPVIPVPPSPENTVKEWTMADLLPHLDAIGDKDRSLKNGKTAYLKAGCATCHRIGKEVVPIGREAADISGSSVTLAAGVLGPDLTGIANRFSRRDILLSILHPSLVIAEKYRIPEAPNVSVMPPAMINVLTREEILDLLAFLEGASP